MTATASAGPSGVAGIACAVDGAPTQWYATSSAQIPVSGTGEHQVQCYAENNAVDPGGVHGTSGTESFQTKIGTATVAAVGFSKLVDKLSCHRTTERVRIPARWVTVKVHGRQTRVHERAHTQRIGVTRCHVRTARRRVSVWVTVRRHGKKVRLRRHKTIRVLLKPHVITTSKRVVGHGRAATVNGWLGTTAGIALAGQPVEVLTAADNGGNHYHLAATATTAADGGWSARLPAGPSRLIKAYYPGAPTTEAALSAAVTLIVPANIELLRVFPRHVAWGGTIHLVGQLKGGYLPSGGALVRLRIGERSSGHDVWRARARGRRWPLHHDLYLRRGRARDPPRVLVSDRIVAHGRIPVRAGQQPPCIRPGRRPPPAAPEPSPRRRTHHRPSHRR